MVDDESGIVVGTIHGGIFFTLSDQDKVVAIFIGGHPN